MRVNSQTSRTRALRLKLQYLHPILKLLYLTTIEGAWVMAHPRSFINLVLERNPELKRPQARQTLWRLKKQGLIQQTSRKLTLTNLGQLRYLILDFKEKAKPAWDKKWRLVIFDVPEDKKLHRDFFRRQLREMGCKQMQKSVWVTPYPCEAEFKRLIELTEMEQYAVIATTERIGNDKMMRAAFGLKIA